MDEGVIKFHCKWIKSAPLSETEIAEINQIRNRLHELGLIGVYRDGGEEIGYGNISIRVPGSDQFIISGTQTGHISKLNAVHYTKVISGNLEKNDLECEGPIKASSESLTHLAIYQSDKSVNAIIHTHHNKMWLSLRDTVPTTRAEVPYGTPAMAREIFRLFKESRLKKDKILVMAGHEDGVMAFGSNLAEAFHILETKFKLTI